MYTSTATGFILGLPGFGIHRDTDINVNSRVKDWLYGIRAAQPDKETQRSITGQALTQAERFRIVHEIITNPREDGGAGITPKEGEWQNVESIFPLHDQAFNKEWMRKWASSTFITAEDLDELRDRLGEKVGKNQNVSVRPRTNKPDCLLLRFYAVLLCFPYFPSGVWVRFLGVTEFVFTDLRCCQWPLVCHVHRVLEAAGSGPWYPLEGQRCFCHS